MRIVLMHFHLKTGGVTTVVRQQAAGLMAAGHQVLLVTGEVGGDTMPAPVAVVPELGYEGAATRAVSPDRCAAEILERIDSHWPDTPPDIIHVHNPTLAKNRCLQRVLKLLQKNGMTLLCQIHDFAEDGRPDVYFDEPYVADCHYAVLNRRDLELLVRAGLVEQGVHYLPNAVVPLPASSHRTTAAQAPLLYPVRAIRRKNIGEAILLALYARPPAQLAITLPPNSPRDIPSYHAWRKLAGAHDLPVLFEVGLGCDFRQLVASCRWVLTTSITEGFGFTFLEPWTAGKALWGRTLPDICRDFAEHGIRLDHLYTRLLVPLAWMDAPLLREKWRRAQRQTHQLYGVAPAAEEIQAGWERITVDGLIDFGLLSEPFQQAVIERILNDTEAFDTIGQINPFLQSPGPPAKNAALIEHNRAMVTKGYAPGQCGHRLLDIYANVLAHPVRHTIDKTVLLNFFLTPERFSLLKWSRYDG